MGEKGIVDDAPALATHALASTLSGGESVATIVSTAVSTTASDLVTKVHDGAVDAVAEHVVHGAVDAVARKRDEIRGEEPASDPPKP